MKAIELIENEKFTVKEKRFLMYEAKRLGIATNMKTDCKNCYNDLAIEIAKAEKESEVVNDANYILNDGVDIILGFNGIRVNAATLTDAIGERMVKAGLTRYFKKYVEIPEKEETKK